MFNLKKSQISPYSKYLTDNILGPKADDSQPIHEKTLPHREGDKYLTTEGQMDEKRAKSEDEMIIEKVLNDVEGKYTQHRKDNDHWLVPPISAVVEKMRQNRLAADYKTEKKSNWTVTFNDKKQLGKLPRWPKIKEQHEHMVLPNDPKRFEGVDGLPVSTDHNENVANENKSTNVKPLVGNITTAGLDSVAHSIKTGMTIDYDKEIVSILRFASEQKRELTQSEQKEIVQLKLERTNNFLN